MISLTKVRLINWYAFSNETVPVGQFTLIAGKNGNGKSVFLDAIKYAAYGDTIFNKSSESKGSRTLSSYTRGLLDATAGTYIRPADRVPNVCTHIVLEFFDAVENKYFLLGAVIETSAANNCQTMRYAMDGKNMDAVSHTYEEKGITRPYTREGLQKAYGLTMLNREQGLPKFLQMTGMRMGLAQLPAYLRRLRGIMSYDPDARVDRFIRESVLEEKNVDFTKLVEAKENIDRLTGTFQMIEEEVSALEEILAKQDAWESEKNRLLLDDIKRVYKNKIELDAQIRDLEQKAALYAKQKEENASLLQTAEARAQQVDERLIKAQISLRSMDCAKMISEEEQHLGELEKELQTLGEKKLELEEFQKKVGSMIALLSEEGNPACAGDILTNLCGQGRYSTSEKEEAVHGLRLEMEEAYDATVGKIGALEGSLRETDEGLEAQLRIAQECRKHRNAYGRIPEYVGLRAEINQAFQKHGIASEAKFACEYVIGLENEEWRDAIEAFLGPRRYTILVDPQYYDLADDVLNQSQNRHAHLFNTKLLMGKKVEPVEDSPVHFLQIRNEVAKTYFAYQLGRMHAVPLKEVRHYENAISKEGRVSVAMDSYFLRFDRISSYYLGQETFELNRIAAERNAEKLRVKKTELLREKERLRFRKSAIAGSRAYFRDYRYDAHDAYNRTKSQCRQTALQLEKLKKAQAENQEYMELADLIARLSREKEAIREEQRQKMQRDSDLATRIADAKMRIARCEQEYQEATRQYQAYEADDYPSVQKAVDAYNHYLENGMTGVGGILLPQSRKNVEGRIEKRKQELTTLRVDYARRYPDAGIDLACENRMAYAARKDRIWMDNLQEIRQKLDDQTKRYEEIFKNEFVLMILKSCERAREELRDINLELAKLQFSAKYQFSVDYQKGDTEYTKIIRYAKYLDEREQLGGTDGQEVFGFLGNFSEEEIDRLEQDLRGVLNQVIEKNNEEHIARLADYRNYMTYEILITNDVLDHAKLSRQTGFNSGAEVQIPYLLILTSALLLIYNQKINSTRLVFIDEPFAKMDPGNVKIMLDFMRKQQLQVLFCAPDKTETIGDACEVILPVLRVRTDSMRMGIIQFHEVTGSA